MKRLILTLSLSLLALSAHAQILGQSTVADVTRTFGVPQFDVDQPLKGYVSGGNIIGVAFDDFNIVQAVAFYKMQGSVSKDDAAKFDNLVLPGGDLKWSPIPLSTITDLPPNCTVYGAWFSVTGNTFLVVIDGAYDFSGLSYAARIYTTAAGAKILKDVNPDIGGWAPKAGKRTNL